MKIYEKTKFATDSKGFFRWLGGRQVRFGHDPAKARINHARVLALWERMVAAGETWNETTWQICTALRKGDSSIRIARWYGGAETPWSYATRVNQLAARFGDLLTILPAEPEVYQQGAPEVMADRDQALARVEAAFPLPAQQPASATLHKALDAYLAHLKEHSTTQYDHVRIWQAGFLREHLADLPLSRLNLATMAEHLHYLARRPARKQDGAPIARETARSLMFSLREFWRWLHRTDLFSWRRPDGHEELRARIATLPTDAGKLLSAVHIETYTPEELAILYRYANPVLRLYILLGLNCGFSVAEFASLTEKEIDFDTGMIRRIRGKTQVYGQWKLWPATIAGLRWAQARKAKLGAKCDALILTRGGKRYDTRTRNGDPMKRLPQLWYKLFARIRKDYPQFKKLPPKQLRKIGADMIHKASNGEIAKLFLAHGTPVLSDPLANNYYNRAYGDLHRAIAEVEKLLAPMLAAVPNPFPG